MTNELPTKTVPTYTAEQVRAAETPYLEAGVPLMQRASTALASVMFDLVDWSSDLGAPRILVLAGSGNNGGDALWAGADLAESGASVIAVTTTSHSHEDATSAAHATGVRFVSASDFTELDLGGLPFDVIVDGIVGTGTSSESALRGDARSVVASIKDELDPRETRVVAVDIPSGLNPDTGACDGVVLPASVTVAFGGVKQGLMAEEARALVGRLVLVDIGISDELEKLQPVGQGEVAQIIDATK